MTRVIPYKHGHLDFIDPLSCYDDDVQERVEAQCMNPNHTAYTLVAGNEPIAVLGCVLTNPKVMNIWAVAGKNILKYPKFYHSAFKTLMKGHVEALKVERVQSIIDADNHTAFEQHMRLGFEVEAKMLKAGPRGQDQYLLRKLV